MDSQMTRLYSEHLFFILMSVAGNGEENESSFFNAN